MVRYYDLFMRFLMIVGLASLLIGGVSVWTGISAYVAERVNVIAILRSLGAGGARVFIHFFTQIAALAAMGVGIGLIVGAGAALVALPIVGAGGRRRAAADAPCPAAADRRRRRPHHRLRLLLPAAAPGAASSAR